MTAIEPTTVKSQPVSPTETQEQDLVPWMSRLSLGSWAVPGTLVLMVVFFSILRPDTFATVANFQSLVGTQAVVLAMVAGLTVVCAVGEYDLSSAAIVGMSASLLAYFATNGTSVAMSIAIAIAAALVAGTVNALFVVALGVNSFVTTLGAGTVITGVAIGTVGPTTIGGLPAGINDIGRLLIAGIALPFYVALGVCVVVGYVMQRTATGRHIAFVGQGQRAAWLVGIRVNKIRVGAFLASALCAGIGGVLLACQTGAASPTYGSPFLLPAYAAVFLGATVHRGRFGVAGSFMAVFLLSVGTLGLQMLGVEQWVTQVFSGSVLVLAVTLATLTSRRR